MTALCVDVSRMGSPVPDAEEVETRIERILEVAVALAGLKFEPQAELSIVFADDLFLKKLNRKWRGKDAATNVLSFPAEQIKPGEKAGRLLGDIIVSLDTAKREADLENKKFNDHLIHLIVHGLLHLFGYDHEDDQQAETMEALEREILAKLDIADPY